MDEPNESKSPYAGLANKIRGGKSLSTIEYESRKPTIRITRKVAKSGFHKAMKILTLYQGLVAASNFAVLINQEHLDDLDPGDSITLEVEPGLTEITIATRFGSVTKSVELEMGGRAKYICCPKLSGIILTRIE